MNKEIILQSELFYNTEYNCLQHKVTGELFPHPGVTRIVNYRKENLFNKLSRLYGHEKAKKMQASAVERGNKIHKSLEVSPIEELGILINKEVFCYGQIEDSHGDYHRVIGTIDALYHNHDTSKSDIIEYKTKGNKRSWDRYGDETLKLAFQQLIAYRLLLPQCSKYSEDMLGDLKLVIVFASNESPLIYTLSDLDMTSSKWILSCKLSDFLSKKEEYNF